MSVEGLTKTDRNIIISLSRWRCLGLIALCCLSSTSQHTLIVNMLNTILSSGYSAPTSNIFESTQQLVSISSLWSSTASLVFHFECSDVFFRECEDVFRNISLLARLRNWVWRRFSISELLRNVSTATKIVSYFAAFYNCILILRLPLFPPMSRWWRLCVVEALMMISVIWWVERWV